VLPCLPLFMRGVPPSAKEVLGFHIAKREHREVKTAK
jgi:hypothetical protein